MRLSADKNSPYYDERSNVAKVLLNGEEIKGCITANEDDGECECYAMDKKGRIIMDSYDRSPMREMRYGKVEIKFLTDAEIEEIKDKYKRSLQ